MRDTTEFIEPFSQGHSPRLQIVNGIVLVVV